MNWTRASRCEAGSCVEVRATPDGVEVRDSKLGDTSPVLAYTTDGWRQFIADLHQLNGTGRLPDYSYWTAAGVALRRQPGGVELRFTISEWNAFVFGALTGDFDIETLAGAR